MDYNLSEGDDTNQFQSNAHIIKSSILVFRCKQSSIPNQQKNYLITYV